MFVELFIVMSSIEAPLPSTSPATFPLLAFSPTLMSAFNGLRPDVSVSFTFSSVMVPLVIDIRFVSLVRVIVRTSSVSEVIDMFLPDMLITLDISISVIR